MNEQEEHSLIATWGPLLASVYAKSEYFTSTSSEKKSAMNIGRTINEVNIFSEATSVR